jgi:GDPmannose 4,6-dehydratase
MLVLKETKIYIVENILITGISGQDGIFLASKYLAKKKYRVFGVSRNKNNQKIIHNIKQISGLNDIEIYIDNIDLQNNNLVKEYIYRVNPSTIINFSGPSSVTKSIVDKVSKDSILIIFDNLINAIAELKDEIVFVQPGSSEMFNLHDTKKLSETSPMIPKSPYAEAKFEIYNNLIDLREQRGLRVINTILFNHESEFRTKDYLFPKIINAALNISRKKQKFLRVGSLDMVRDWSFAGDIVNAIDLLIEKKTYEEFVIGSGVGITIENIISYVFGYFELDYKKFIEIDPSLLRKDSPQSIIADPTKINNLGWKPTHDINMLLDRCISFKVKSTTA